MKLFNRSIIATALSLLITSVYLTQLPAWTVLMFLMFTPTLSASGFVDTTMAAGLIGEAKREKGPLGMGTGAAFGDYNNDGFLDLYIPDGEHTGLYQNRGDGSFVNVLRPAGVQARPGGAIWGDYDNDGFLDLFVNCWDAPEILYRNNGDGTFTDVTKQAGIGDETTGGAAAFVDYDNDGDLDLYVGNYTDEGGNVLYRNDGSGAFTDVTVQSGLQNFALTLGICFFDFDNDNDSDLYLANDFGRDYFYRNRGDGTFEDISLAALGERTPENSMGIALGDYDGDGFLDLYITDIGENTLYRNRGDGSFEHVAEKAGVADAQGIGWGTGFFDYDLDGTVDLYAVNGDLVGPTSRTESPNRMYLNRGDGTFFDHSDASGIVNPFVGRGSALGDYDNDGDTDVFIANEGSRNVLLRNDANRNNWITIQLIGVESNRSAIGARIHLTNDSITQIREICGGGSYISFNSLPAEFGLGESGVVDEIEVRWPSGLTQELANVGANQSIVITEGEGGYTTLYGHPVAVESLGKRLTSFGTIKLNALYQNYPNPFNPETWIPFQLAQEADVTLQIYDIKGSLIRTLALGTKPTGIYFTKARAIYWDGRDDADENVASGAYFYTLKAGELTGAGKMVLQK